MRELKFSELEASLKNKECFFHNIYNLDLSLPIYYSNEYYLKNPQDTADVNQPLHVVFTDIEVYHEDKSIKFNFTEPHQPINAITIYSTKNKTYHAYFLLKDFNYKLFGITEGCDFAKLIETRTAEYKEELLKEKYITEEEDLKLFIYNDEIKLLTDVWNCIREKWNPVLLSGFNSDNYDYPYIYRRITKLFDNDKLRTDSLISQFNFVEFSRSGHLKIIDYPICDLQYLFKPRSEGGMNLGKTLANYSLDSIAFTILGIRKKEFKSKTKDHHEFYEQDPINFLLYNIADVALCVRLNSKLQHIELQNLVRRMVKLNFSQSLIGSSALYESFVLHELLKEKKFVRYGITSEIGKEISIEDLKTIPVPLANNKIKPEKISKKDSSSWLYVFDGAYVKKPTAKIINTGTIMDLDASLPPYEKICIKRDNKIEWINIGDYIWIDGDQTLTWGEYDVKWGPVLAKLDHDWSPRHGKLLKFTTSTNKKNKTITVTDNHSVYGMYRFGSKWGKVNAASLRVGDYLLTISAFNKKVTDLEVISNIEEIEYTGKVYDLSVGQTERFFAGGGIGASNTRLYPSMIQEFNISFDTFTSRILPPQSYKLIGVLKEYIGNKKLPVAIFNNIYKLVDEYIEREGADNKYKAKNQLYYIICYHLQKLAIENITIEKIFTPSTDKEAILLKHYLVPLIDIFNMLSKDYESYNSVVYDYLFDTMENVRAKYSTIFILINAGSPNSYVQECDVDKFLEYTQNYILGVNGTYFKKHEDKLGMFFNFLESLANLRNTYRQLQSQFEENSDQYAFFNARQKAIKVIMNSGFGVLGLKSYRYSNNHLAQAITSSGRLSNKLAQFITNQYISSLISQ